MLGVRFAYIKYRFLQDKNQSVLILGEIRLVQPQAGGSFVFFLAALIFFFHTVHLHHHTQVLLSPSQQRNLFITHESIRGFLPLTIALSEHIS